MTIIGTMTRRKIPPPDPDAVMRIADECSRSANDWLRAQGHFAGRDLGPLELEHFHADGLTGTYLDVLRLVCAIKQSGGSDALAAFHLGILADRLRLRGLIETAGKAIIAGKNRAKGRQASAEDTHRDPRRI
jgi:hypothetical protein